MKNRRGRLTYANVISTIALFLVLAGGTAFAREALLPRDSVGTKQLKPRSVTLAKLSRNAERSLRAAIGPAGPAGRQGDRGAEGVAGRPGVAGEAGHSGAAPLDLDASGEATEVVGSAQSIPLSGTTSWTSTSGQVDLLTGTLTATVAKAPTGYECFAFVAVYDNGVEIGEFGTSSHEESLTERSASLFPVPIGIDEPGVHTFTAKVVGAAECKSGSKIDSLRLVMAPLGG